MRRIRISSRAQAVAVSIVTATFGLSLFGTAQIAGAAPEVAISASQKVAIAQMRREVAIMRSDMSRIRKEASAHATRLDQRQAFLDAVLTGHGTPALPANSARISAQAAEAMAPLNHVEARQAAMASKATEMVEARYRATAQALGRFGLKVERVGAGTAMGGPYEPVDMTATKATPDPAFRALFQSWKRLDNLQQGIVAIPSQKPVEFLDFTSGFGVRSDPFRGGAAMHTGVDIRGPVGTPIHATADGIVTRSGWASGYGNLVELSHGRGIQTRYGHLSAILVQSGQRVKRGDVIARMGSTGRSTGSHLHYEVRLDGSAVNPMPFLQSANYLAAMQTRGATRVAMGGPAQ